MTDLGLSLVSNFWRLIGNLSEWKYKDIFNKTNEYLKTLSIGNLINYSWILSAMN